MYKTVSFKKKLLATLVASSALGLSSVAFAQDEGEEIVITGIKASLQRAVDIKRDAAGVVDAISSEDIGKMPDANLAESLQRITGISIDRNNGEGARITSRGFGPAYNLVTLNGRQLSTASLANNGDQASDRSFDMSNIASESVSGVEVYKTGKASVPTGGIGATVNIKTAKPFDHEGFKASVGGKALYDESRDINEEITPELSGFVSWSNDMFGASLSVTHQERNSGTSGYTNANWGNTAYYPGGGIFSGGYTPNAVIINEPTKATPNVPGTGDLATRTNESQYLHTDTSRMRDNSLLTLQFKPTDKITATLDVLNVETKSEGLTSIYSLYFSDSAFQTHGAQWDDSTISSAPLYWWMANPNGNPRDLALKSFLRSNKSKTEDVGLKIEFQATDELSFELDVHEAKSSATPWNAPGSSIALGIGTNTVLGQGLDLSGELPLVVSTLMNGSIKKSEVGSTVSQLVNGRTWQDVSEAKVSGKYEFSDSGSINFGFSSLETESIQRQSDIGNATMKGGWSVAAPGDINPNWFELINFNDYFDGYSGKLSAESKAFFAQAGGANGTKATANATGVRVTNFNAVARHMFAESQLKTPYAANKVDSTDRKIAEDIQAAYVETNLEGSLGDMKVNLSAGLRYETTDVESYSRVSPREIVWTADRDFSNNAVGAAGSLPYTVSETKYRNVLPNVDLTFHVSDEVIVRASSSKTIARPSYDQLQMGAAGATPRNGSQLVGGLPGLSTDGNVKLKPVESNNIDISAEYYFNDTDYVSIGFFDKRVPNFIGSETLDVTYPNTLDPSRGPRAIAALAALQAGGHTVNERTLFQMVGMMTSTANGCINQNNSGLCGTGGPFIEADYLKWSNGVDIKAVAGDPGVLNRTTLPTNSKDAVLQGWEFAGQYFFGDSGFGVQANYTIVNGSIKYTLDAAPGTPQFALLGLSDSANVVGIYEKDQWQARIAYNWRDNFLNNANDGGEPQFTDAYGQVDLNVGYKVTEDLTVALEATNLLGEDQKTYGRTSNQVRNFNILEPRYSLSARYNF